MRRVSSYLAFPPLLEEMQSISKSGISLLHLSEGHPWRALPVILALWSPDFPHAQAFRLTRAAILIEKKTFVNIILVNKVQKRYNTFYYC